MDDVELWRNAATLMTSHGEAAQAEALRRADLAIVGGDIGDFNRWKRVARLILELQSRTPGSDVH